MLQLGTQQSNGRRKNRFVMVLSLVSAVIITVSGYAAYVFLHPRHRLYWIDDSARDEALHSLFRPGMSAAAAMAEMDRIGIEHSNVVASKAVPNTNIIYAIVRSPVPIPYSRAIQLKFFVDDKGFVYHAEWSETVDSPL